MKRRDILIGGAAFILAAPAIIRPSRAQGALTFNSDGTFTVAGADYTGVADSGAPIQAAQDYIENNYGVGKLWLPRNGNYRIANGITIRGGIDLLGHGRYGTVLNGTASNVNTVTFTGPATGGWYPGMKDIWVQGYNGSNRSSNAVVVNTNCPAQIRDSQIWFGFAALYNQGSDGRYYNVFIGAASNSNIGSTGANFYISCKIDSAGGESTTYGFLQGSPATGLTVAENTFDQCDFSGNYQASIAIDDGGTNTAVTTVNGGILSSPIQIARHRASIFAGGCKFGSNSFTSPSSGTLVVGCVKYGNPPLVLPFGVVKSGNVNIM